MSSIWSYISGLVGDTISPYLFIGVVVLFSALGGYVLWLRYDNANLEKSNAILSSQLHDAVYTANENAQKVKDIADAANKANEALAQSGKRMAESAKKIADLKAKVKYASEKPSGCVPSISDKAPAVMLDSLRSVHDGLQSQ